MRHRAVKVYAAHEVCDTCEIRDREMGEVVGVVLADERKNVERVWSEQKSPMHERGTPCLCFANMLNVFQDLPITRKVVNLVFSHEVTFHGSVHDCCTRRGEASLSQF